VSKRVRGRGLHVALVTQLLLAAAIGSSSASAQPVSGPRETLDFQFTTTQPNTPTGWTFTGTYHAADDPDGPPPYMRRMTFYHPPGMMFDTSVPGRCTATDAELAVRGPAACPADSHIGAGTVSINFMNGGSRPSGAELFNNSGEQIIVGQSPLLSTIVHSRMYPDQSVEYESPTCWPAVPGAQCPVDDALQMGSSISVPPYTREVDGVVQSYLTTPPVCPVSGHWETPIRFWWADGSIDTVVTEQPCTP
jgi:hypothetical protein